MLILLRGFPLKNGTGVTCKEGFPQKDGTGVVWSGTEVLKQKKVGHFYFVQRPPLPPKNGTAAAKCGWTEGGSIIYRSKQQIKFVARLCQLQNLPTSSSHFLGVFHRASLGCPRFLTIVHQVAIARPAFCELTLWLSSVSRIFMYGSPSCNRLPVPLRSVSLSFGY